MGFGKMIRENIILKTKKRGAVTNLWSSSWEAAFSVILVIIGKVSPFILASSDTAYIKAIWRSNKETEKRFKKLI